MSQYRPPIDNLLATVRQFLDHLAPQLADETRYKAQVSSFLLAICERELGSGNALDEADRIAWAGLLGGAQGNAAQLKRNLCTKIREGGYDEAFDPVLDVVLTRTAEDVRIVRPDHLESAP